MSLLFKPESWLQTECFPSSTVTGNCKEVISIFFSLRNMTLKKQMLEELLHGKIYEIHLLAPNSHGLEGKIFILTVTHSCKVNI